MSSTLVDRSLQQLRLPSGFVPEGSVPVSEPRLIVLQLNVPSNSSTEISFFVGEKKPIRGRKPHINITVRNSVYHGLRKFSETLHSHIFLVQCPVISYSYPYFGFQKTFFVFEIAREQLILQFFSISNRSFSFTNDSVRLFIKQT